MEVKIDYNLNYYFKIKSNKSLSIKEFKQQQLDYKLLIFEKNLKLYNRLNIFELKYNKFNIETYNSFIKKNKFYINSKSLNSYNLIKNELKKIKINYCINLIKNELKKGFKNYIKLLKKEVKRYKIRSRFCDKCGSSYLTFLKHSRHCFNCKIETSVKNNYDIELKKELERFYFNIHKRNKLIEKINYLENLIK